MNAPVIWGLTSSGGGMASQVRGVGELLAEKSGGSFVLKQAKRRKPFCWLPGDWYAGALKQVKANSDSLAPPYPDVLITSGRRSVPFALDMKKASGGKTKLVHIQGPRIALHHFDLVVPMEHDRLTGENVFPTFAAMHHLTEAKLQEAAASFKAEHDTSTGPRVLFLIGGSTNAYELTPSRMQHLLQRMLVLIDQHHGSAWITTSRRTGEKNIALLQAALAEKTNVTLYIGEGKNPYLAWLAGADQVVATNDSVNMMSEALYARKPLYILPLPEHINTKPANFADTLVKRGFAKPYALPFDPYTPQHFDERAGVVAEICKRLGFTQTNA